MLKGKKFDAFTLLIILIETFLCAERAKSKRAVRECCQLISYINIEV